MELEDLSYNQIMEAMEFCGLPTEELEDYMFLQRDDRGMFERSTLLDLIYDSYPLEDLDEMFSISEYYDL